MGKTLSHMTMSLDGYIADPDDQVGELFDWYEAGDVTVPNASDDISFEVDDASAEALRDLTENTGALIAGRRLFEIADGWNDQHPVGAPVVVVTHRPPANAAERWPTTTFGLVDEVCLVPVLFGEGVPYFSKLEGGHMLFDDPIVVQGRRALHLRYRVSR